MGKFRMTPTGRLHLALDVARGIQALHEIPGGPMIHTDMMRGPSTLTLSTAPAQLTWITLAHLDYSETYTWPFEGTVREVSNYITCKETAYDDDDDDDGQLFGGVYYFVVPCPDVHVLEINGMACEEGCGEYPDGQSETWSCTDVDPTIVEKCGDERDDDYYDKDRAYLNKLLSRPRRRPLRLAPTSSPNRMPLGDELCLW
jgi:hypothetical protein